MIYVLGKTPDKPGDEPEQKPRQYNGVKCQKESCRKPQNIGNVVSESFSP